MGKAAATKQTTTATKPLVDQRMEQFAAVTAAKQQFLGATMNMGVRLAVTVVIPLVAGVKLDEHFNSAPSMTITGLFIAVAAGSAAVWKTIKEVTSEQDAAEQLTKKETRP